MAASILSSTTARAHARSPRAGVTRRRVGVVGSALPILFMLFDGGIKLARIAPVVDSFRQLGWPVDLAVAIGLLGIGCTVLYAIPRTSPLGAVLLTGYLGGAIATQLRVQAPTFSLVFPLIIAALVWGGLFLRDDRVRVLLAVRR